MRWFLLHPMQFIASMALTFGYQKAARPSLVRRSHPRWKVLNLWTLFLWHLIKGEFCPLPFPDSLYTHYLICCSRCRCMGLVVFVLNSSWWVSDRWFHIKLVFELTCPCRSDGVWWNRPVAVLGKKRTSRRPAKQLNPILQNVWDRSVAMYRLGVQASAEIISIMVWVNLAPKAWRRRWRWKLWKGKKVSYFICHVLNTLNLNLQVLVYYCTELSEKKY